MKLTVSKETLLDGLQKVQNVVSTRTTLPVLSNVLLEAVGGELRLSTTDLDCSVRGSIEANVDREGASTLPARRLFTIVRELPNSQITLEIDNKNLASMRCANSHFKIFGLPHEDFPSFPTFEEARSFTLPQKDLLDALRKTSYAISNDETRYVLNGLLFSFRENRLTLVATDGRRLALADVETEFPRSQEIDFIVPSKAINEMVRLLGAEGEATIRTTENQASFDLGHTLLTTKLIDGNYPNFRQVIPGEPRERIELERESFLSAVHRIALLTTDKSKWVKLAISKNSLDISADTPDIGEAHESLPIKYTGPTMKISFDPEFLMGPLRNLADDAVYLNLIDELSPAVLKVASSSFLYVLMPMRTQ